MSKPRKPSGLKSAGGKLWDSLVDEFEFSEAPEALFTLGEICREADLIARLQKTIDEADSLTTTDRYGRESALSALSEVRQHRQLLNSLIKSLNLPSAEGSDYEANGKLTRSAAGRRAAAARWGSRGGVA